MLLSTRWLAGLKFMRDGRSRRSKYRAGPTARRSDVDLGPLTGLIGYMLRRAQIAVFQEAFRTFARVGIRPAQFSVLAVIAHNPGRTQSQVAAALGIKRTNFVALLDSLERRGLAVRRSAPTDRRSHALHLTEAGKATLRRLNQMVDKLEARMIAQIGKDGGVELIKLLHCLADIDHPPRYAPRKAGHFKKRAVTLRGRATNSASS
jgi:DNA-binding MarR family transcriptional regulator